MKSPLDDLHWTARITLTFLFKHMMAGVVGGVVLGFLLLYFNVSNLWGMISTARDGWIVLIMLFTSLCLTFGSISMGWGIFSLAQERDEPPQRPLR